MSAPVPVHAKGVCGGLQVRALCRMCSVVLCERQCQDAKALIAHLKNHTVEGCAVDCPVIGGTCVSTVKSSCHKHNHKVC